MSRRLWTPALLSVLLVAGGYVAGRPAVTAQAAATVLKGATVVTGDGRVLQGASIVLRAGLIEEVGTAVKAPPGAFEVDLKGAFAYPGLIDMLSDAGLRKSPAGAKEPEPTDTDSAAMFADVQAADLLDPAAPELASWRNAGILALNVAPNRGIFMGQTALVLPNGEAPDRMVLKRATAMRMALQGLGYRNRRRGQPEPGGVYPTRLIGVLAYIRQTLLDAHYYDEAMKTYDANPRGLERPALAGKGLEALRPVAAGTMRLMFPADQQREVVRVLDIADDTRVNCTVVGGYEAPEVAAELKRLAMPVAVSLDFPTNEADVHAEFEVPVSYLRFREHAPKAAAELQRAGVTVTFASAGLKSGEEFLSNLRLTVRQGLPKDAALRAATLGAAEVLGVDRQLGSIEAGKIANLVITDGDLFDEATRIRSVYVDGRRFDVPPARRPAAETKAGPAKVASVPQPPPTWPATPGEVLIKNATVMTVARGTLRNASVLIRNGKVAGVGPGLAAGPQALVIDGTGKWVSPGIIDAHEHNPTDSHNEATLNVTAQTRLKDNLNPTDYSVYQLVAAGVTTVHVLHGSVDPVGGQTAIVKMRWGKDARGLLFEGAPPGLKMTVEEYGQPRPDGLRPTSYMGEEVVFRETFRRAQRYRQQWEDYERQRAAGRLPLLAPRRDLAMDALVEVLKGERAVHVHALSGPVDDPRGMLMIMRLADEFGFRIRAFHHAPSAFRIAPELARHGAGASIFSVFGTETIYNAAILLRHGVVTSVNSDGSTLGRDLNQQVGLLTRYGVTEDEALGLVTLGPARQLGIDKRVGSIEVGKDADLVLWTAHPLSLAAIADTVLIDGQVYFSRARDKEWQAWLGAEARRLRGGGDAAKATPAAPAAAPSRAADPAATPARATPGSAPGWVERAKNQAHSAPYVIQHARILTVSGPPLTDASLVIKDGLIAEVGTNVSVPPGAKVIDGKGLTVTPGLFDADSTLGMTPSTAESQMGQFLPHLTASTSFTAWHESIPVVRALGVTHVLARPTRGVVAGQGQVMNLAGWHTGEMLVPSGGAMLLVFPTVGDLVYTEDERFQVTPWSAQKPAYDRRMRELRQFFATARAYLARKQAGADAGALPDAQLEAMVPVLTGTQPVIIETANHVDIRAAVEFAKAERLNYVIGAAAGAWRVADFLKENGVRVLLGSTMKDPESSDLPYDTVYRTAAILHAKDVPFAFSTLSDRLAPPRLFAYSAGKAIAFGLPPDAALRAVTLAPAEFLGVADRLGSIEKGKIANLVVAAGDVLETRCQIKYVFIDGEPADLRNVESDLYEQYRRRPVERAVVGTR